MKHLKQLQQQLKESLPKEGISPVLKSLRELLPENSPKYNLLLQLESEYRDLKLQTLEGVLSQEEIKLANNQMRKRLLEFIDGLEAADFDAQTKRSRFSSEQKIRKGHVLYRIPHRMQLWEESRCLVRIAFDKAMLVEDLDLDEDTRVKMDLRISDYMKVEVIDPASEPTFEIRTTSEAVQLVDEDDFTEWRYYVKPLRPGEHILELKVTIMLVIDGEARVRERTLEESVVIVAEPVEEEAETAFKRLDEQLTLPCAIDQVTPSASGFRLPKGLRAFALGLIGLLVVSSTAWAVAPPEERNWIVTRYFENTEAAYQEYIEQFPESDRRETATFRKAKVREVQDPEAYREYVEAYPNGKYVEPAVWQIAELSETPEAYLEYAQQFPNSPKIPEARQEVKRLETKVWQEVQSRQDLPALDRYFRLYPEGQHKQAAQELLQDSTVWEKPLPQDSAIVNPGALQDRLWQKVQSLNSAPALQQFVKQFPESPHREAARTQLNALTKGISQLEPTPSKQQTPADLKTESTPENKPAVVETSRPKTEAEQKKEIPEPTPVEAPVSAPTDIDQDGIPDVEDKCPEVAGTKALKGCPPPAATTKAELPNMVLVKGGTFDMGDQFGDGTDNERPVHKVTVSDFYIGATEVTFDEYDAFCAATGRDCPDDRSWGRGKRPVINVSWLDAVAYCNWLSEQHRYTPVYKINGTDVEADWSAKGYRLPTEAEWEYAARQRGQKVRFGNGKDIADSKEVNFDGREDYKQSYSVAGAYRGKTIPVGSLNSPNKLGLHDMSGNVYEWCWDWYGSYPGSSETDPRGPKSGSSRVFRGGGWISYPVFCRAAYRLHWGPTGSDPYVGFRLARS